MADRIAGTCYVKVDGEQIEVAGSVTVSISMFEKEGLSGLTGVAGYKETPRIPFIEVEAYLVPGFPVTKLEKTNNATVTAELANGQVAVLSGAWLAGAIEAKAEEGTTTLKFQGLEGKWI